MSEGLPLPGLQDRVQLEVGRLVPQARAEARRTWSKAPHALDLGEMESVALFGLAQAGARWAAYCSENSHDPWAFNFFTAYCLRRIRGAMTDSMRKMDWATRSERAKAKLIRDASQSAPLTDEEVAAVTGLDVTDVRAVAARVAARPVSIDAEPVAVAGDDDVESTARVNFALKAAERTVRMLPEAERDLVLLRFVHGMPVPAAAAVVARESGTDLPPPAAVASLHSSSAAVRSALALAMGVDVEVA